MPKIVTTFTGKEIDVSEHEEAVLRGYGVVVDTTATTQDGARRAAARQTAQAAAQNEES